MKTCKWEENFDVNELLYEYFFSKLKLGEISYVIELLRQSTDMVIKTFLLKKATQ